MSHLEESQLVREVRHSYSLAVSFGKNIRRLRVDKEMRAKELAERLGVKQGTLSDWERDRRGLPETPTLIKFAKALGCSVDDLLAGVDAAYDEIVIEQRDLLRHGDPRSSSAAHSQAQRKGAHVIDGAVAARLLRQQIRAREALATTAKNAAMQILEAVNRDQVDREDQAAPAVESPRRSARGGSR